MCMSEQLIAVLGVTEAWLRRKRAPPHELGGQLAA